MDKMRNVVLYGNSLVVSTTGASLDECAGLEVVRVEAGRPDAAELIRGRRPCAVLFDLAAFLPGPVVSLLREQPDLLLVGLNPSSDELLVLSVKPQPALSLADLVEVILQKDSNSASFEREGPGKTYPG